MSKKLISTENTEFAQNGQPFAIIDDEFRAGKPTMLSAATLDEAFNTASQEDQEAFKEILSFDVEGEEIEVVPTTNDQVITPSVGKNAITKVTVEGVGSDIDENIQSENIRSGVSILGVNGSLSPGVETIEVIHLEGKFVNFNEYTFTDNDKQAFADLAVKYVSMDSTVPHSCIVHTVNGPNLSYHSNMVKEWFAEIVDYPSSHYISLGLKIPLSERPTFYGIANNDAWGLRINIQYTGEYVVDVQNISISQMGGRSKTLTVDNNTPYTPTNDYNPATKKFTLDSMPPIFYFKAEGSATKIGWWDRDTIVFDNSSNDQATFIGFLNRAHELGYDHGIIMAAFPGLNLKFPMAIMFSLNGINWSQSRGTVYLESLDTSAWFTYAHSHGNGNMGQSIGNYKFVCNIVDGKLTTYDSTRTEAIYRSQLYLPTDNTMVYNPTQAYHPATKKFVEDYLDSWRETIPDIIKLGQYDNLSSVFTVIQSGSDWWVMPKQSYWTNNIELKNALLKRKHRVYLFADSDGKLIYPKCGFIIPDITTEMETAGTYEIYINPFVEDWINFTTESGLTNSYSQPLSELTRISFFTGYKLSITTDPEHNDITAITPDQSGWSSGKNFLTAYNNWYYEVTNDYTPAHKKYVDDLAKVESITNDAATYTIADLTGHKSYKLGEITSLTVTASTASDYETNIYFESGSTATEVTMPNTITNLGDAPVPVSGVMTCTANKKYIISVLNDIAIWREY